MVYDRIKRVVYKLFEPLVRMLARAGVNPNAITAVGFVFCLVAAVFYAQGKFPQALVFVFLGGISDMLDGNLARERGRVSKWGAFFDSSLDRYSEIVLYLGILLYYMLHNPNPRMVVVIYVVAAGSLMISYTRARAEGVGVECKVGLLQRPDRFVLLFAGTLLGGRWFEVVLWILAVLTHVTALHRIWHVRRSAG